MLNFTENEREILKEATVILAKKSTVISLDFITGTLEIDGTTKAKITALLNAMNGMNELYKVMKND